MPLISGYSKKRKSKVKRKAGRDGLIGLHQTRRGTLLQKVEIADSSAGYRDVDDNEKPLRKVIDSFKVGGSFGPGYYKRGGIKSAEKPGHFFETQTSYLGGFSPRSQYAGKKQMKRMSSQIDNNRENIIVIEDSLGLDIQKNRTGISRNRKRISNNTAAIKKLQKKKTTKRRKK